MDKELIHELAGYLSTYHWYETKNPEELMPLAKFIYQFLDNSDTLVNKFNICLSALKDMTCECYSYGGAWKQCSKCETLEELGENND